MGKSLLPALLTILLTFLLNSAAIAADCISRELSDRIAGAIGDSHRLFTSGRYAESQVLGRRVLQFSDGIPLGRPAYVDPTNVSDTIVRRIEGGATNLDLMKSGNAPIGPDGKHYNLHHLFGEEPGPIAEITTTDHQRHSKVLHQMIENSFRDVPAKKSSYKTFKRNYWKARAAELEAL